MFAELNAILNSSPDHFKQGEFILVSDRRADASFLVHHFLSFYLRAGCRVCFLGLAQSFSHYSAVSQRLGVSLTQAKEKGQLLFLEGLQESLDILLQQTPDKGSQPLEFLRDPAIGLRGLHDFVRASVSGCGAGGEDGGGPPPVLLVDDLTVLLSLGGNMVMLVRCEGEEDEDEDGDEEGSERLLKGLTHQCSLTLHVQGLPTGFCRDIHGQVEVCWRNTRRDKPQNQKKLFQYKVHDKGASFFARGTSSAVL
ncbi:hypothetical protein CRUP_012346 [Coryphaenoides rupestris]|nr:hypothetical protein CRUP_012346 [Coryphaenoides rupestris]